MTNYILGLFTAWFGKKIIAFIDWTVGAIWVWCRATPRQRYYAVVCAHIKWMDKTLEEIKSGKLHGRQKESMKRFHHWANVRLDGWYDRIMDGRVAKS